MGIIRTFCKNKKSQFYILTAAIFCFAVFTAFAHNTPEGVDKTTRVEEYINNFIEESPKVINTAVLHNANITLAFEEYIYDYRVYLEEMNENLNLVYLLAYDRYCLIKNYYTRNVTVIYDNYEFVIHTNDSITVDKTNEINLKIDNEVYNYNFEVNKPIDLKLLFIYE